MQAERKTPLTNKDLRASIKNLEERQNLQTRLSPYRSEISVDVGANPLPLLVVHAGDTHFAHDDSDPKAVAEAVKETGTKGLLILHGNVIDGVSPKFIRTNTTRVGFDLDTQEALIKQQLKPLDKQGRVVVTSGNTCHEGWAAKNATHDPARAFVGDETPILFSGGQIIFRHKDKEFGRVEAYHKPGHGNTRLSPTGADRARSREKPFGVPNRAKAFISGHTHELAAGQDLVADPISRTDYKVTLGVVGTAKGSIEKPDQFLISLGVPPSNQPADAGRGLVTIWTRQGDELEPYPVAGYDRARILYQAILFRELADRAHATDDIRETMERSGLFPKPEVILEPEKSLLRTRDSAAKSEGESPLYKTLAYNIRTNLPVRVQFLGNLRIGSSSFERDVFTQALEGIELDPWAFYFATRRLVNQGTSASASRDTILEELANLLGKGKSSILGLMLTDELRNNWWTHSIRRQREVVSPPKYPGDWLYQESAISGTPLVLPEVVVPLHIGETDYVLYMKDQLSHFASLINPNHGLTRVEQIWGINADVMVGGNTEVGGWQTLMKPWGQLDIIIPGGFAEYMEKGVGNRVDFPIGGQGVIFSPDGKLFYSFATPEDGQDMHQALSIYSGVTQLGTYEEYKRRFRDSALRKNPLPLRPS